MLSGVVMADGRTLSFQDSKGEVAYKVDNGETATCSKDTFDQVLLDFMSEADLGKPEVKAPVVEETPAKTK